METRKNNEKPYYTVSVAIATYNGEKYIKEQLNSILCQSHKPDEIVISDGGSTDNTVELCREILSSSLVKSKILVSQERLSPAMNFQHALEACDKDYVLLSDQDDVWMPHKVERMLAIAQETDADLIFSNAEIVDSTMKTISTSTIWDKINYHQDRIVKYYSSEDTVFLIDLLRRDIVTGMTACISKRLKNRCLPFCKCILHDVWIALIAATTGSVAAVNENLVKYRQHESNAVGADNKAEYNLNNIDPYTDNILIRKKVVDEIFDRNKDDISQACRREMQEYIEYMNARYLFVKGNSSQFSSRKRRQLYYKYEIKPWEIYLKDYIIRRKNKFGS